MDRSFLFKMVNLSFFSLMVNAFCDCLNALCPFQEHGSVLQCVQYEVYFIPYRQSIHPASFNGKDSFHPLPTIFIAFVINQVTIYKRFCFSIPFHWVTGFVLLSQYHNVLINLLSNGVSPLAYFSRLLCLPTFTTGYQGFFSYCYVRIPYQ